jgi:hypothetical protein
VTLPRQTGPGGKSEYHLEEAHDEEPDRQRGVLVMRTLSSIICGHHHPLTSALSRADMARDDALGLFTEALAEAAQEMERLPALTRRRLLSSYGTCVRKYPDAAKRRPGRYEKAERKGAAA